MTAGMLSRVLPLRRAEALREQTLYDSIRAEDRARYAQPLRPLKLVVMSATLRVDDFLNPILFPTALPPVVRVEARQFPVTTHFSKRTELRNYLKETFKKVCQIHKKLPEGGVLVFLTGKREILYMCSKLHRKLNSRSSSSSSNALWTEQMESEGDSKEAVGEATVGRQMLSSTVDELMEAQEEEEEEGLRNRAQHESTSSSSSSSNNAIFGQDGIDSDSDSDYESDEDDDEQSIASIDRPVENQLQPLPALTTLITGNSARDMMLKEAIGGFDKVVEEDTAAVDASAGEVGAMDAEGGSKLEGHPAEDVAPAALKAWILPLYALMPSQLQNRVFQAPPEGHRLIVVATNVAETSITIPGIRYVVDCGRQKMKVMSSSSPTVDPSDRHASSAPVGAGAGIAKYEVTWISQASADQRQGRAGRTAPGHCYRLFSSNYFHQHMQPFRPPEIAATPLEELVLQVGWI